MSITPELDAPGSAEQASPYDRALALHRARRFAEADALLRVSLAANPDDVQLWNLRGINLRRLNQLGEAVWCLRQGIAIGPERVALWSNLGNVLVICRR